MTKQQLINLGAVGYTKSELVNSANNLYTELKAENIDDFKNKVSQFIPIIKIRPNINKYRKEIKNKYDIKYLKNSEFEKYKERFDRELASENFDEILRIARLNEGWLKYEDDNKNERYYRINENNIEDLRNLINGIESENTQGSDNDIVFQIIENIKGIRGFNINNELNLFIEGDDTRENRNVTGGFLLKGHTLPFDFSRYGLFRKDQDVKNYHKNNCLYHAFKAGGMSDEKLEHLKTTFYQRDISIKSLKKIAEDLDIKIKLTKCYDTKNSQSYGESEEVYNIAILEGHYFINEDTKYHSYVIENYNEIPEEEKKKSSFMNIVGKKATGGYEKKMNKGINSKRLLEIVLEKHSYTINKMDVLNTVYHHKIESRVENLNYSEKACRLYVSDEERENRKKLNNEIKKKNKILRIFFDFETVAKRTKNDEENDKLENKEYKEYEHVAREVCAIFGNTEKYWSGYNCGQSFVNYVLAIKNYDEIHLIAHNAGFDFNFIAKYLPNLEICKNGSKLIYTLTYNDGVKIYVKDSMAFINNPLRDFHKIFNIPEQKAHFNHKWIEYENLDENGNFINPWIKVDDIPEGVKLVDGKFNVQEYSKYYNILDVKVLKQGYEKFSEWSNELGVNIDEIFTASSLAKKYAEKQGCFKGCYELSAVPQCFISQAIIGGRVMTQENKSILLENTKIATLDANSLYPSAMISMDGFLKGRPKVITPEDLNIEFLNRQDYYYVDIEILKVGKNLKMPLLFERTEDSINYTNDMIGKTITVGKIYLEDLIKYQEIDYKIIRGYYFNDGFNTRIRDVINNLYTKRNELKKQGNRAEMIYKLIMNSIYGKCLQKPRDKKLIVKNNKKDALKYIVRNETNIEYMEQLNGSDKWLIRSYKEIEDDFNYVHIGGHILDNSKRIMNEVITLAEDNDIDIYYTDTDSMHLKVEHIKVLEQKYKELFNKELINNDLLGFKQDFGKDKNGNELYATKAVFIGKKTYIDFLNDGDVKVRAKGITERALYYNGTDTPRTSEELFNIYKDRHGGKTQIFDLTCGGNAFTARQKSNYTFVSINNFTRTF
jgi:hypothetical protein